LAPFERLEDEQLVVDPKMATGAATMMIAAGTSRRGFTRRTIRGTCSRARRRYSRLSKRLEDGFGAAEECAGAAADA
jgi:hypothetical protein